MRVAAGVAALLLAATLAGCSADASPRPVARVVTDALAAAPAVDPVPDAAASATVADAAVALIAGGRGAPQGWQVVPLTDVTDGSALVERARPNAGGGVIAVRGRSAKSVAVAVPVPGGQNPAESLGLSFFTSSRSIALVVAGSPTAAASADGVFRAVTDALSERGVVLAVVEGYAPDADAASPEVVLRGAAEQAGDEELRLGTLLQSAKVEACVLVGETCVDPGVALEQTDEQTSGPVVRIQLAGRLVGDAARRDAVVAAIAAALDDLT